jgi:fumarate reductase subunit D
MLDFLKMHFDKLLLLALFCLCMGYTLHGMHRGFDDAFVNWAQNITGQVLAALLTLMVGTRLTARNGDHTYPPTPPTPPALPNGAAK